MIKELVHKIIVTTESEKEESSSALLDKKLIIVLITVPFCLTMIHYLGRYDFLRSSLITIGANELVKKTDHIIYGSNNLGDLSYWVLSMIIFYFLIPAIIIKLAFKQNLSEYGLKLKGAFKDYYLYIIMLLVMVPLVLYFSSTTSFQDRYPFLTIKNGESLYPDFWKWELMYCAQFFALEFFFRGFVLFGLKHKLGIYSVFVMTIPYCMIHFGKPLPETLAAIVAGIILGFLSLKNKSIWLGFLIHCSVGLSMDLAALWQKRFLY
jgi:membrane protease YdiL (CAAX protease family)